MSDLPDPFITAVPPGDGACEHDANDEHVHVVQVAAAADLYADDQAYDQESQQRKNDREFLPDIQEPMTGT